MAIAWYTPAQVFWPLDFTLPRSLTRNHTTFFDTQTLLNVIHRPPPSYAPTRRIPPHPNLQRTTLHHLPFSAALRSPPVASTSHHLPSRPPLTVCPLPTPTPPHPLHTHPTSSHHHHHTHRGDPNTPHRNTAERRDTDHSGISAPSPHHHTYITSLPHHPTPHPHIRLPW